MIGQDRNARGNKVQYGGFEMLLHERLEAAEALGAPLDALRCFSRVAAMV